MKVEIENLNGHFKKLNIEVPADIFGRYIDDQYKNIQKSVELKGFRKGKAPIAMVKQLYKDSALGRAAQEAVEDELRKALRENSFMPVNVPEVSVEPVKENEALKFSATFENIPPVELKKYTGLKLDKKAVAVTSDEINATLDRVRSQMATLRPVDEGSGIEKNSVVRVDYEATHNGEAFPEASDKDSQLELGTGNLLDDFEKNLVGMKVGETKSFTVKFPEAPKDTEATPVAGKTISFTVTVHAILTKILPEWDETLLKNMGFSDKQGLETRIEADLKAQKEEGVRRELQEKSIEWLVKENPVEVPQTMINTQMQQLAMDAGMQLSKMGLNQDQIETRLKEWGDDMLGRATRQVKASMLLGAIAKQENIQASEEDIRQEILKMALQQKRTPDQVLEDLRKQNLIGGLFRQLTEIKALDWVAAQATGANE